MVFRGHMAIAPQLGSRTMVRTTAVLISIAVVAALVSVDAWAFKPAPGNPSTQAMMQRFNAQIAGRGLHIALEQIDYFTVGRSRPVDRLHQEGFRWVASDARRAADGTNITYLVDQSDGATTSGLTSAQTEAAIDRALSSWQADPALKKVHLVKRADTGADPDIVDGLVGFGSIGDPFLADIVEAGWLPRGFFDAIGGPSGGSSIIAVTFSFIFTDDQDNPTDVNGDNFLDTAASEVYYNDAFGSPGDRAGYPWGINVALPGIDVESIALHENGHALGIDHFGPPPAAVMNPFYDGIRQSLLSTDHAAAASVWGSWPK